MDRKSISNTRPSKPKSSLPHHGSELFALGGLKTSEGKSKSLAGKSTASSTSDRKRDPPGGLAALAAKKPKLNAPSGSSADPSTPSTTSSLFLGDTLQEYWEEVAIDCEVSELVTSVLSAMEQQDSDKLIGLVCGAIKLVISTRTKLDNLLTLSLSYLAKLKPNLFCNEVITNAILAIFKKEYQPTFKGRPNNLSSYVLGTNLLMCGYRDKTNWPESFVKLYVDDATNERFWVDNDDCSLFVENICTAFSTKVPPKYLLLPENLPTPPSLMPKEMGMDEESSESHSSDTSKLMESSGRADVQRFTHIQPAVEKLVLEAIKEHLNRRQAPDCSTRNFLKFLSATCGICDVRAMAITRLELWINNGKLLRPAQELLTYICCNITGHVGRDQEVLANLVKMRLKTKQLINIYMTSIKEMINSQPDILFILLKFVVQNELSNARHPNNMGMLTNMFQTAPDSSAEYLADIYKEFLLQREDCIRTLRVFLRELVKMLRYDVNLVKFCKALTTMRPEYITQIQNSEFRDRVLQSLVDLICLSMFLSVSPQVREANNTLRMTGDLKINPTLNLFYNNMATIQLNALIWMHEVVAQHFKTNSTEYTQLLHKLLFLEAPESYTKSDQWPPEPERALLLRLVSEIPVHQDSMLCIIYIGMTKEIPFSVPDTMEIIEQVVRRAAGFRFIDFSTLMVDKIAIIEYLFSMAEYHHPEKIALPVGYEPPKLAISVLYWKVWNILLMLSAHNPATIGSFCWEQYPMLRNLMEFCITNQFQENKTISEEEADIVKLEKQQILEFEAHLAAATSKVVITEQNSLLLSQLMLMDPMGVARKPPLIVLEQLRTINITHRLGHLLCRSRKPDLLLQIIQKYGTSQSMPWLADLVQNSDGDFSHLPVQCLCEFLLSHSNNIDKDNVRDVELINYLQNLLRDGAEDNQIATEVIEYFLQRLSSPSKSSRQMSISGLRILLRVFRTIENQDEETSDWLLLHLPDVPQFAYFRALVIAQLRAACQIENNSELISLYIQFIATHTMNDSVPEMLEHVMDMSQLIVERQTVFSHIIPSMSKPDQDYDLKLKTLNCLFAMFNNYFIKLREQRPPYNWNEYNDLLIIRFYDHSELPVHLNIFHGFIILMTFSNLLPNAQQITDFWFPMSAGNNQIILPQGFNNETMELVNIFPDWLKLKMIRCPVERLVDASIQDLNSNQIVLFLQSFGTPIPSMSKLLALLDIAVIEQFEAVKASIIHKTYLVELIEIQQQRGAKNGHIAMQALLDDEDQKMEEEKNVNKNKVTKKFNCNSGSASLSVKPSTNVVDEIIETVFDQKSPHPIQNRIKLRKLIEQISTGSKHEKSLFQLIKLFVQPTKAFNVMLQNVSVESASMLTVTRFLLQLDSNKLPPYGKIAMIDNLLKCFGKLKGSSSMIELLKNKRKVLLKNAPGEAMGVQRKLSAKNYEDFERYLQTANLNEIELNGKRMLNELLVMKRHQIDAPHGDGEVVKSIITVLQNGSFGIKQERMEEELSVVPMGSRSVNDFKKGLLVDWLANVDPELVSNYHTLQMDLLFKKSDNQFRFYLLSLLSHQTSWQTLRFTSNELLKSFVDSYDPTTVLDFIESILNHPKLWQGRDKLIPITKYQEFLLSDREQSFFTFALYVVHEQKLQKDYVQLSKRIDLLIQCMGTKDGVFMQKLIKFLINVPDIDERIRWEFLLQCYSKMPFVKLVLLNQGVGLDQKDGKPDMQLVGDMTNCAIDKITHYLLTALICCGSVKDWQILSHDVETLLIKLASTHPYLFLRHLNTIPALMQGRLSGDFNVNNIMVGQQQGGSSMSQIMQRNDFQLQLFHTVFNILEVLQPKIYHTSYTQPLHDTLNCYLNLFYAKEAKSLLTRFIDFLKEYLYANQSDLRVFLQVHHTNMVDFGQYYNHHHLLQFLQQFSYSMIDTKVTPGQSSQENTDQGQLVIKDMALSASNSSLANQDFRLINALTETTEDDKICSLLLEWENNLQKQPLIFESSLYFEKILQLLLSYNEVNRTLAHNLMLRFLKVNSGNPAFVKNALMAYVQCLENDDISVVNSTLEILNEAIVYLQEYAKDLLNIVFNLGITSQISTYTTLKKCVSVLKLQHAC